jgi:hypothetical protein
VLFLSAGLLIILDKVTLFQFVVVFAPDSPVIARG